jgi:hypothetical protein
VITTHPIRPVEMLGTPSHLIREGSRNGSLILLNVRFTALSQWSDSCRRGSTAAVANNGVGHEFMAQSVPIPPGRCATRLYHASATSAPGLTRLRARARTEYRMARPSAYAVH